MGANVSQITSILTACSVVCLGLHQRKHQSYASLAFVRGNHRWPVDSPHKAPVTRKIFPLDDVVVVPNIHDNTNLNQHRKILQNLARFSKRFREFISSGFHFICACTCHKLNADWFRLTISLRSLNWCCSNTRNTHQLNVQVVVKSLDGILTSFIYALKMRKWLSIRKSTMHLLIIYRHLTEHLRITTEHW